MEGLQQLAVEAYRVVVEIVVGVLAPEGQLCGHEEAFVERIGVLRPDDGGQIRRLAVCVGIFPRAVIAVARYPLRRCVYVAAVARVGRKGVETQAAAVDVVFDPLGDLGHVGRQVERVAAAAEFVYMVVLGRQLRAYRGLVVASESDGLRFHLRNVAEPVAVAVVCRAVLYHAEQIDARAVVVGYERAVERGVVFGRAVFDYVGEVRHRERVAQRLLGYDVHHAAYGVRAE